MLSLQECVDFCGLSAEEISIIAEHEHLPQIVAAELGCSLVQSSDGVGLIKRYMLDNLEAATQQGHFDKASQIARLYRRFDSAHP